MHATLQLVFNQERSFGITLSTNRLCNSTHTNPKLATIYTQAHKPRSCSLHILRETTIKSSGKRKRKRFSKNLLKLNNILKGTLARTAESPKDQEEKKKTHIIMLFNWLMRCNHCSCTLCQIKLEGPNRGH